MTPGFQAATKKMMAAAPNPGNWEIGDRVVAVCKDGIIDMEMVLNDDEQRELSIKVFAGEWVDLTDIELDLLEKEDEEVAVGAGESLGGEQVE